MSTVNFDQDFIKEGLFCSLAALKETQNKFCGCPTTQFEGELNQFAQPEQQIPMVIYQEIPSYQMVQPYQFVGTPSRGTRIDKISFKHHLARLIDTVQDIPNPNEVMYVGHVKGKNRANASKKRSNYIGVCKNGPNWQALISIDKKKTYIGTYMTDKEAAEAYDFYCMMINGTRAKTNFGYTKEGVEYLISKFGPTTKCF
jgi:hypothetical protein